MTQKTLAFNSGTSPRYIQQIESGVSKPSIDILLLICEALECHPMDIIDPINKQQLSDKGSE